MMLVFGKDIFDICRFKQIEHFRYYFSKFTTINIQIQIIRSNIYKYTFNLLYLSYE